MQERIFKIIAESSEPLGLVTIVNAKGSTPRQAGTRMLVKQDGTIYGTIGGGSVEAHAIETAKKVIAKKASTHIDLGLNNRDLLASGMVCGGAVGLWVEYISDSKPYAKIANKLKAGKPSLLLLDLNKEKRVVGVLDENRELIYGNLATVDQEISRKAIQHGIAIYSDKTGLFYDPVLPSEKLLILGGGHIGLALSNFVKDLGFRVTIGDFRAEIADPKRFSEDVQSIHAPFAKIIEEYEFTPSTYVVVSGPSHTSDFECVKRLLHKEYKYLGCVGSRNKITMLHELLKEEGFNKEKIESIYAPIGVDINAETPKEIAVSILSELIAVRRDAPLLQQLSMKLEKPKK